MMEKIVLFSLSSFHYFGEVDNFYWRRTCECFVIAPICILFTLATTSAACYFIESIYSYILAFWQYLRDLLSIDAVCVSFHAHFGLGSCINRKIKWKIAANMAHKAKTGVDARHFLCYTTVTTIALCFVGAVLLFPAIFLI